MRTLKQACVVCTDCLVDHTGPPTTVALRRPRQSSVPARLFFTNPKKLAEPVALIERTRMDPLGKEDSAKPMQFPALIRLSYFQMFADRQRGCRAE